MSEIDNTLNERSARYGNYSDVASTTQQPMSIVECGANYEHLNAEQKTSLFIKGGLTPLIENSLMTTEGATNAKIVAQRVVNGVLYAKHSEGLENRYYLSGKAKQLFEVKG